LTAAALFGTSNTEAGGCRSPFAILWQERPMGLATKVSFHHYRQVSWRIPKGPYGAAYQAVVVHDECPGCVVCRRSTEWFLEFALLARQLVGLNLRDCVHWAPLTDNPHPLIVPASNLERLNRDVLRRLRNAYYALPEDRRPALGKTWHGDAALAQSQRFEDRLKILERMIELWEQGQYIGWPS
jgi:hypothetical protein